MRNVAEGSSIGEQLCDIAIVLCPFFFQYQSLIPGITLGELLLVFACTPSVIKYCRNWTVDKTKIIVAYYFCSLTLSFVIILISDLQFTGVSMVEVMTRWIRYGTYVVFFVTFIDNYRSTVNALILYRKVCLVAAIYTILQTVIYYAFGVVLPIKILPFPWNRTNAEVLDFFQNYYFRGFGPFIEPSDLAKFLLPGLAFSLYGWEYAVSGEKSSNNLETVIILAAILCSTSVQGILIAGVTCLCFLFSNNNISPKKKVAFLILFMLVVLWLFTSDQFSAPLSRITGLLSGEKQGYSSGMRLFRGFAYWGQLPFINKLVGVGLGCVGEFAYENNIVTEFDHYLRTLPNLEYGSGISLVLVQSGLIGFSFFVAFVYSTWKRINHVSKSILIQLIMILASGSGFLSVHTFFCCYLIFFERTSKNGDKW